SKSTDRIRNRPFDGDDRSASSSLTAWAISQFDHDGFTWTVAPMACSAAVDPYWPRTTFAPEDPIPATYTSSRSQDKRAFSENRGDVVSGHAVSTASTAEERVEMASRWVVINRRRVRSMTSWKVVIRPAFVRGLRRHGTGRHGPRCLGGVCRRR